LPNTHRPATSAPHHWAGGPERNKQIRERLTLITLSEQGYVSALQLASSGTIVGPATYDALIAHCALKAGADILLTWNVRDFTRLGSAVARVVKTPLEL
jgi:predicted nucleic acid-binding protein